MERRKAPRHSANWEATIEKYQNLIAQNPHNAEYHKELGNAFHRAGQHELALEEYRTSLHIDPNYYSAQYNIGNTYFVTGSYHKAIIAWQKAFIMNRSLDHAIYNIAFTYYRLAIKEDNKERRRELLDDAVLEFQKTISMRSDSPDAHLHLGLTWFELAKFDDAIQEYGEVLRLNPQDSYAHYNLGNVYYELGSKDARYYQKAISEYERAIQKNPDDLRCRNNIADCLLRLERFDEAMDVIQKVLAEQSDYIAAHCTLGEVLSALGQRTEAIAQFRKIIALDPEEHSLLHRYAANKLIEEYEAHLASNPTDAKVQFELGCAYRTLGISYDDQSYLIKARDALRKAVTHDGSRLECHLALAETLVLMHRLDDALLEVERSLQIDPDCVEAHCILGEVYTQVGERDLISGEFHAIRRIAHRFNGRNGSASKRAATAATQPAMPPTALVEVHDGAPGPSQARSSPASRRRQTH